MSNDYKPLFLRLELDVSEMTLIDVEKAYRSINAESLSKLPRGTWQKIFEFEGVQ